MIACFPDPYPDELLYSLCARYTDRMQYPSGAALVWDLVGKNRFINSIELPIDLDSLLVQLPIEYNYTIETLINSHTLFPLYAPFLLSERVQLVRTSMRGEKHQLMLSMAGVVDQQITSQYQLRFCVLCVAEDRVQFGEAYWHRVHQAPGVEVCPTHGVFVSTSSTIIRSLHGIQHYFSAEALLLAEPLPVVQPMEHTNATHRLLLILAQDIAWLLNHPQTDSSLEVIHTRYMHLLSMQGFATLTERVRWKPLLPAFRDRYPAELLIRLRVPIEEAAAVPWPVGLVRKDRRTYHPLRHLLMIYFLEHTVESFLQFPVDDAPFGFGHGPWPCLNPVCDDYHQRSILTCQISYYSEKGKEYGMVGEFACKCGFVYTRSGPDRDTTDVFRHKRISAFGPVWETRLTELWFDATYSLRDIARLLGVNPSTILRHAQQRGLPCPRPGRPSRRPTVSKPPYDRVQRDAVSALLPAKRAEWLAVIQNHRDEGTPYWKGKHRSLYSWLGMHDWAWRKANTPPRVKQLVHPGLHRPDYPSLWAARDAEYAPAVRVAAARIRAAMPLERVTQTSIRRALFPKRASFLSRSPDKLPRTTEAIAEEVETYEQFQLRRIAWIATRYRDEGRLPTRSQFELRAIVHHIRHQPTIRTAVDAAFHMLKEALTNPPERVGEP